MWADETAQEALGDLGLSTAGQVLDAGCGSGEFTRILADRCPGRVVGADRDHELLAVADYDGVRADVHALPFSSQTFDIVACQALLINLPEPGQALKEFARITRSGGRIAAVEPDNAAVSVESTVTTEARLAARARKFYVAGASTDVALGSASDLFKSAGLSDIQVRRHEQTLSIEPPYSEDDLRGAARKAKAADLRERRGVIANAEISESELDGLRSAWRKMGREAVRQVSEESYRRVERVPFYVTVGRV
jgi:SAM-dependent methyltransferase